MIALFENCSSTSEAPKAKIKPLKLAASPERIYRSIISYINEQGYYGVKEAKQYYEIFYFYAGFEVTLHLTRSEKNNATFLNAMVYGKNKRGKTRKMLKRLLTQYEGILGQYLA